MTELFTMSTIGRVCWSSVLFYWVFFVLYCTGATRSDAYPILEQIALGGMVASGVV